MPPVSQSPGTTSQGSILLIEEYDALAAAIRSALRKFAPRHRVQVARSLTEAKAVAKEKAPALLVIDFDPAFPGLSPFLQKIQKTNPDARVLILAGKLSPEITVASHAAAVQFIEKPFDVPDFGAAVQALLGPWTESETATSRGTLQDAGLADLLLAQCAGGRAVAIEVKNDAGKTGEIHLKQGLPVHAETGRKSGEDALGEMLRWTDVEVRERERPGSAHRTIEGDWSEVLLQALQQRTKTRQVRQTQIVPAEKPHPKTGKKVVVVDDTEMLIIFVEDVLTTADRELQVTTALNGVSGVKEIERVLPDLVLLDYSLPDINGDEVCRRLLQQDATAKIPVLMMSGHVPEMSKAAATCDNVVATIEKPFLSDALVTLVQQLLTEPRPVRKKNSTARKPAPPPPPPVVTSKKPRAADKKRPQQPPARPQKPSAPVRKPKSSRVEKTRRSHGRRAAHEPVEVSAAPAPSPKAAKGAPEESPAKRPEPPPIQTPPPLPPAEEAIAQSPKPVAPEEIHIYRTDGAPSEQAKHAPQPSSPPIPKPPQRILPEEAPIPSRETISTSVFSDGPNEVVLTLFLDVVSVQLTPELRMGSIRARPSSAEVSLHFISPGMRAKPPQTGFKLGQVALDSHGRIATVRLVPTLAPFKGGQTRNSLQIGGVSVVPIDSTKRVQLTPTAGAPMTLQLLVHLEFIGVELSPTFQVSQLVLKDRGEPLRVSLNSQPGAQEQNGTKCETVDVRLDHSAHIAELLLNPLRS